MTTAQDKIGEWREVPLGEVIELKRGYDLSKKDRVQGTVPVVSSSGVSDYHSEVKVAGPGVVTGRYGTIGEVYFVGEDFWPLNTALYVRDFKGNDPRFISYFLRVLDFSAYSDKAAVPGVNRNHLHQAIVRYPVDIEQQRAIAGILGALDDKIELNRRMNETLEQMARALFQSWFVDFDPVRAKMEGREPNLPPVLWALFPERLVDSELGEIPEGWEVKTLGEICTLRSGSVFPKLRQGKKAGDYPFIKVSDMNLSHNKTYILGSANWVEDDDLRSLKGKPLPNNTIVFAKIGEALKQNRFRILSSSTLIDNNMMGAVPKSNEIKPLLLYGALSRFDLSEIAGGTALPYLTVTALSSLTISIPPIQTQKALNQSFMSIFERIRHNATESLTLAAQRDALLPRLVSGELRV